jgi:hypothetical protein
VILPDVAACEGEHVADLLALDVDDLYPLSRVDEDCSALACGDVDALAYRGYWRHGDKKAAQSTESEVGIATVMGQWVLEATAIMT